MDDNSALLIWIIDNLLNESQLSVIPPSYDKRLRELKSKIEKTAKGTNQKQWTVDRSTIRNIC